MFIPVSGCVSGPERHYGFGSPQHSEQEHQLRAVSAGAVTAAGPERDRPEGAERVREETKRIRLQ